MDTDRQMVLVALIFQDHYEISGPNFGGLLRVENIFKVCLKSPQFTPLLTRKINNAMTTNSDNSCLLILIMIVMTVCQGHISMASTGDFPPTNYLLEN